MVTDNIVVAMVFHDFVVLSYDAWLTSCTVKLMSKNKPVTLGFTWGEMKGIRPGHIISVNIRLKKIIFIYKC